MSTDLATFSDGSLVPPLQQPLSQPIEGTDESLATVILPAPPPLSFVRLPLNKRPGEHAKRPLPSFIPSNDPGSTYATHHALTPMTVTSSAGAADSEQVRRKRARTDKSTALASGIRPARNSGRHTPVGHAASSPLRGDFATESATTPRLVNSSHIPFVLRPHQNGAEPPTDQLTPIDTTSPPSPAKRSRGRPRKPDEPPGGEIGEFEAQDEPEPETIISALRDLGTVMPFRNDDVCACCAIPHSESNASPLSHFLYCDGCTRSFHMGCLDPPIVDDAEQPPPEKEWFCPSCTIERATVPPLPPDPGPFDYLRHFMESAIPRAFSLPEDIRGYFKDVAVGRQGAYVNSGELKPGRANRHGFLEDRDPNRVKDRNNNLIVCFKCQRTALPRPPIPDGPIIPSPPTSDPTTPTFPSGTQRPERRAKLAAEFALQATRIVSCDYCSLHWHLDCLDPPMVQMPSPLKKWMCPNHVEHDMPKRRAPKVPKIVEVTRRGMPNNGNIEIIPSAEDMALEQYRRFEEVWINSKRYMIPERSVRLDFLDKVHSLRRANNADTSALRATVLRHLGDDTSHSTSPLTSLSSSSDDEDRRRELAQMDLEEMYAKSDAALSLLSLHERRVSQSGRGPTSLEQVVHLALSEPSSSRPRNGVTTSPSPHSLSPPPVKAGSTATSFRIRINRGGAGGKVPQTLDDEPVTGSSQVKLTGSGLLSGNRNGSTSHMHQTPLSPQEIQRLLHIRALMQVKGEQRMMEFLTSDD